MTTSFLDRPTMINFFLLPSVIVPMTPMEGDLTASKCRATDDAHASPVKLFQLRGFQYTFAFGLTLVQFWLIVPADASGEDDKQRCHGRFG
jgi:hypothetical protein